MKKLLLFFALILLVFSNFTAFAQEDEEIEKDNLELCFNFGLDMPSGDVKTWSDSLGAKSRYSLGLDVGYYMTPDVVVGFNFTYNDFSIDNSPTDTLADNFTHRLYQTNLYLKYYVPTESNWSPYLKIHGGLDFLKFATFVENNNANRYRSLSYDPVFGFGFGAGLFYYTSDYSGIFLEANYHMSSSSDTETDYGDNTYVFGDDLKLIDLHLGIRVLFGDE